MRYNSRRRPKRYDLVRVTQFNGRFSMLGMVLETATKRSKRVDVWIPCLDSRTICVDLTQMQYVPTKNGHQLYKEWKLRELIL